MSSYMSSDVESLKRLCESVRKYKRKIVTTNGAFDLLHIGHIQLLQYAKTLGGVLIVGVNSDTSVKFCKGNSRPFYPEHIRAKMVMAIREVNHVHIFDEIDPREFLKIVKPDIHVNSYEYIKMCVEKQVVEENGGDVVFFDRVGDYSTTSIIKKIKESE